MVHIILSVEFQIGYKDSQVNSAVLGESGAVGPRISILYPVIGTRSIVIPVVTSHRLAVMLSMSRQGREQHQRDK